MTIRGKRYFYVTIRDFRRKYKIYTKTGMEICIRIEIIVNIFVYKNYLLTYIRISVIIILIRYQYIINLVKYVRISQGGEKMLSKRE